LVDLLEKEDAVALRLVVGLHDPGGVGVLLKLVKKDGVLVCLEEEYWGR
jgi:hypothetical protein